MRGKLAIFVLLMLGFAVVHDASAGPLKRMRERRQGGGGDDAAESPCQPGMPCYKGPADGGSLRIGHNQSITGEIPQYLWPTNPDPNASQANSPGVPFQFMPPANITVPAPVPGPSWPDVNKPVIVTQPGPGIVVTPVPSSPATPAPTAPVVVTPVAVPVPVVQTPPAADPDVTRMQKQMNAMSAAMVKAGIKVENEEEQETPAALLASLPTLELRLVYQDHTEAASIDLREYAKEQLVPKAK